jgi:hypothetical protein
LAARFATPKVLLLTPFVESMNKLIRDYLAACGVEAISPADTFDDYRDAMTVEPDDVYALTEKAFKANPDGLFFFDAGLFEGGGDLLSGSGAGSADGVGPDRTGPLAAGGGQQSRHALVHAREGGFFVQHFRLRKAVAGLARHQGLRDRTLSALLALGREGATCRKA